ncbi:protein HflC [Desulfosarcina ovata subsp. sediminis]|uniref:Protein HflC n=3 Tax=Desulfosarcina ovata TaxID=83564 RepID=A0A5K8AKM0_9BACT|nr:protein HflC [Desulfosarcina ovata subsp. sediminis]BBO93046.1 protein HflC [Desulfosarcina ovata subsp. ovata]
MNRIMKISLGMVLLAFFLGMLFTYQVNFDEVVLVTTFGRATQQSVINQNGDQAGLHLKWPWPIQTVYRMDRRDFVLEDRLEQQETKDRQVVIAKAFAVWRIDDPLQFHRMFRSNAEAEDFLKERLRATKAEISRFTFDELTNADPQKLRLDEVQQALFARMRSDLAEHTCGIEVVNMDISRILLPERITRSVFSRMKQTRQRFAQNARSEGKAIAQSITAETNSDKQRIIAFTDRVAQNIRAQGDAAAAQYYAEYNKDPEFALFLRKLEALEKSLKTNTTFVLDTDSEPFDLLKK